MDWRDARPIVLATIRWCRLLGENGRGLPSDEDVDHSALLRRLLDGKEPLREPPPLANRTPWYAIVDHGTDTSTDVWDAGDGHLVINQSRWKILEHGAHGWRVQWKASGPTYRVESVKPEAKSDKPMWRVTREP
jgi:hypothetical protein